MKKVAKRYKVTISVTPVHRHLDREIEEIWIPELKACVNEEGCFKCEEPRSEDVEDIEIDLAISTLVKDYLHAKSILDDVVIGTLFKIRRNMKNMEYGH